LLQINKLSSTRNKKSTRTREVIDCQFWVLLQECSKIFGTTI